VQNAVIRFVGRHYSREEQCGSAAGERRIGERPGERVTQRPHHRIAICPRRHERQGRAESGRREDPRDRRVRRVELTAAGRGLVDDIAAAGTASQRRLLDRLSLDDLAILERAFGLLADAAEAERAEARDIDD